MEKASIDFSYKVPGGFSPNGMQKIFISFHPSDIKHMEQIADDLTDVFDCAIYYHTDQRSAQEIDLEDYELKLREMKLFIVIVTTKYLLTDSLSKNWEYGFAVKNNIPLIPIAVENDLESLFCVEMNRIEKGYGDIQLLRSQATDRTEISYLQKLYRDIGAILVDNCRISQIEKAFAGRIFLSYRKKDRKYANELMRLIHDIPSLRNVSIWYDEFITAGEKWDDRIKDALKKSDLFLLMVTPSIAEQDNYVIKEEYPEARKQEKQVVSVKKTEDPSKLPAWKELLECFPGLPTLVDGENAQALEDALNKLKDHGQADAETDYLIGLAFFNGIGVEKDIQRAVSLIAASAKSGLPDAVNRLASMYWCGDGVKINYEVSVQWRKKLIQIYEVQLAEADASDIRSDYIDALENLTVCLYALSSYRASLTYAKRMLAEAEKMETVANFESLRHWRAQAYDYCAKNSRRLGLYEDVTAYSQKYYEIAQEAYRLNPETDTLHNLSVACGRMGDAYYACGDMKQAEEWYLRAFEIDSQIYEDLKSADAAHSLAASGVVLGDIYIKGGRYKKANQYYAQAVELRRKRLDAKEKIRCWYDYAEVLIGYGTGALLQHDIERAETLFSEARDITKRLADEQGTFEAHYACSVAQNRCARICEEKALFKEALEYYSDSLRCRGKILAHVRTAETVYEYALTLFFKAEVHRKLGETACAKSDYEEVVERLRTILSKDFAGNWHRILAEAAFERFKMDTFGGRSYLQYAIDAWKWLSDRQPDNKHFCRQYEICRKIYGRCYPS